MYGRRVRLECRYEADGEAFFITEDLRVTFEMETTLAQGISNARISLYNLEHEEIISLLKSDHSPVTGDEDDNAGAKVHVTLRAGYDDERLSDGELPTLVVGWVMNATTVRVLPNAITNLYVLPVASFFVKRTFTSFQTPGRGKEPMTLRDVLVKMCTEKAFTENQLDFLLPEEKLNKPIYGKTFTPDIKSGLLGTLHKLQEIYKFKFSCRASGIGFYPYLDDSKGGLAEFNHLVELDGAYTPYIIRPERVQGTPLAGLMSIEIKYALKTDLFPGYVVDTGQIQGERTDRGLPVNGIVDYTRYGKPLFYTDDVSSFAVLEKYMVQNVIQRGDTHGEEWVTIMTCGVPTRGDQGSEEAG